MAGATANLLALAGVVSMVLDVWARFPRQRCCVAVAVALSVLTGWSADAQAGGPAWLEWSAPPECPAGEEIEQRVSEWVGAALPAEGELFVRTTLARSGERWDVGVVVSRDGQTAERRVLVSSCAAAADLVAIVVALAVDPGFAERLENDAPAELPSAGSQRETSAASPVAEDSASSAGSVPGRSRARGGPSGESEPDAVRPSPRFRDGARRVPWKVQLTLWGEDAWGALPSPTAGLGVGVGAVHGRWSVELGGRWLAPVTKSPERAVAPIEFSLVGARGTVGYRLLGPRVQLGPLASVEGGAVRARQQVATNDWIHEPWWALGIGAGAFVELSDRIGLTGQLELTVPATRPTFVLSDGSEVYQVGPGGRGLLGASILLDSR
jgi:hypothetical protein